MLQCLETPCLSLMLLVSVFHLLKEHTLEGQGTTKCGNPPCDVMGVMGKINISFSGQILSKVSFQYSLHVHGVPTEKMILSLRLLRCSVEWPLQNKIESANDIHGFVIEFWHHIAHEKLMLAPSNSSFVNRDKPLPPTNIVIFPYS